MQNFVVGLRNMDATSFDAHQFYHSAGLICREGVSFPPKARSSFGKPSAEVSEVEEHVFFDKKELRESGEIVLLDLSPSNYLISFLPNDLAEMMPPFSLANVSQILNLLSESNLSRNMVGTMEEGEVKRCSTSIEGMVEFVVSVLGSDVDLLSDPSVVGSD
ncbi:hypothetical protein SUGI_0117990 [Cryptomeria japonica]|nr:hypothetical protein SUGI_0117990 [Cryptomeria japonica]